MNLGQRKKTMLFVQSREALIETVKPSQRRTKIIASISDNSSSYERVKEMVVAGANCLNLNITYQKSMEAVQDLANIRDRLEQELNTYIPLNLMLKGIQIRVGSLQEPEIFLKKGQQIRLIADKHVIGDQNIVCIDDEQFFESVRPGYRIVMDYGQVVVSVKSKEDSDKAYQYLMQTYPDLYPEVATFHKKVESQYQSDDFQSGRDSLFESGDSEEREIKISTRKQQQALAIQKEKEQKLQKKYTVLVCTVQGDCVMKPYRPVFILREARWLDSPKKKSHQVKDTSEVKDEIEVDDEDVDADADEDLDQMESHITSQDIRYIKKAKKCGYDSITISNVHREEDLVELKEMIGPSMKAIIRITTIKAVENFEKLIKLADGCLLARAYLAVQSHIEQVVQQQNEMIKIAHKMLKPVVVSSQILESMITSLIPTFSEMADISSLVNEDVDAIMLTGETTYGSFPVQCISTLNRVCKEVEANQNRRRCAEYLNSDIGFTFMSSRHLVSNTLAQATVDAAYRIGAQLIIVFTSTGSTAVKISKLRPPSPIIAVTGNTQTTRLLQMIGGIHAQTFGTLYGTQALIQRVLDQSLEEGLVQRGNFVVIITGQVENVSGQLNTLRIMQV